MNWDEVSAIGQMLGSIAVFLTLGYLAVQVRHARDEVARSIAQARAEMLREQAMTLATDAGLTSLTAKVTVALGWELSPFTTEIVKRAGVSAEAANRLMWVEQAWWAIRSQTFRYLDVLPSTDRPDFDARMRRIYGGKTLAGLWYQTMKSAQDPNLTRYIDDLLAKPT